MSFSMDLHVDLYAKRTLIAASLVLLAVVAAYSNHFQNNFHFDDSHAIVQNVYIQDPQNIPKFFSDARLFSTLPDHQVYQPVTVATLAVDYWIAGGLKPLYFHLSTFIWFLVMLTLLFFIFRTIMEAVDPSPWNPLFALLAVGVFGLHPAIAETVNYIIQRADVLSTLGVVAALFLYDRFPASRKWGWYMAPAVLGMLAKAPALIFPLILLVYVFLFQMGGSLGAFDWTENRKKWVEAAKATLPAFVITAAVAALIWKMTPTTFTPGGADALLYRMTQPFVALRYLKSFFLPTELSADSDWTPVPSVFSTEAIIGVGFVVAMLLVAVRASRNQVWRPISFGIIWFLLALVPTSITPLAEVTNDHRMFFAFIGLALSASWGFRLLVFQRTQRLAANPNFVRGAAVFAVVVLVIAALGTRERNRVWATDESLWKDVTIKSPKNGRGLMNYGLTQMEKGDYAVALDYFEHAQTYAPNYSLIEINLGIANGGLKRDAEAERHFLRAIQLAPDRGESHYFYGRWLRDRGRTKEAIAQMQAAVRANPYEYDARHLLMQIYSDQGNWPELQRAAEDTLRFAATDSVAQQFLNARHNLDQELLAAEQVARGTPTAEQLLNLSLLYYQAGRFPECIQTAKRALELNPNYAEAYNNIAAGYNSLRQWDEGVKAASEAIRLKPDFELAKNNLAYAMSQKAHSSSPAGTPSPGGPAPAGSVPAAPAGAAMPGVQPK